MNDFKFKNNVLHVENVSINNLIKKFDKVFGILKKEKTTIPKELNLLLYKREKARKDKNWKRV